MMSNRNWEAIFAMFCITIIEVIALLKGIDGMFLSTTVAVIAGLGGFWIGKSTGNSKKVEETDSYKPGGLHDK